MYQTRRTLLALLQACVFSLCVADTSDQGSGSLGCNYHYLVPDEAPLTGIINSYNYPFSYQDDLTCQYFIHVPLYLVNDGNKYQICFKFHRFDLEDCFDKLLISEDTFCGKGRLDHSSPEIPTRSIWTQPLCYSLNKDGYIGQNDAYLQLTFDSDMRDVRRGFYAEYNVSIVQDDTTNFTHDDVDENNKCGTGLSTFRCFDRSCTPMNTTCDGVWNCPDYSDETYMHAGCNSSNEVPAREGWICDFESGETCGNFRVSGWKYFSPKLHSKDDEEYEPDKDHTYGQDHGYFMTTDFGSQTSGVVTANFPITLGDNYYCLTFWYQMRGQLAGRLDVHWGSATDGLPLWTRNGTSGFNWQKAHIPIYKPTMKKGDIVFRATRHSARSRISVDDFALLKGQCQFQDDISCNFETQNTGPLSGTCGWELYNNAYNWDEENHQWQIVKGNTVDDYSIYRDRSPENNVLKYTTKTLDEPGASLIMSPIVSQGLKRPPRLSHEMRIYQSKCLAFWYYTTSAQLTITFYAYNGKGYPWQRIPFYNYLIKETDIWQWKKMKVDLPNDNRPFRVLLMVGHNRLRSEQTIAFDEFTLVGESCSYLETLLCPPGYFACKNGMCILERDRCNGYFNCRDQSDETKDWAGCTYGESCQSSDFRCVTEQDMCIPRNWVCDGSQDCNDRSDERNCPSGPVVPPAAIGAICAAAIIVIGFITFKLAYSIWKNRQYTSRTTTGGSAHELPDSDLNPAAFEPPPTYAQCVDNPAYMPEDVFKPPEVPGGIVTAGGDQRTVTSSQPLPPAYERVLSGEFKELTAAEQRKISRGESISTEFSLSDIPRELRANRSGQNRSLSEIDPSSTSSRMHPSVFMTSSSQATGHLNVGFTNDEFSEILSAMQTAQPSPTHSKPDFVYPHNQRREMAVDPNGAYSNSGYRHDESPRPEYNTAYHENSPTRDFYDNAIEYHNSPTERPSNTQREACHISSLDDVNETTI